MALPWVRLDSNIGSHDKILDLLADPSPKRWQAAFSYTVSLGYSGGHGTDGRIPKAALPFVHGTPATAALLCKYRLWQARTADWLIVNYAERQELTSTSEAKREAQSRGGRKSRCIANHGSECGCWKEPK
ncbi:hypothetical protein [Nocardioides montaniterrae]